MFEQDLEHLLDQRNDLYKLANRLPWERFELAFESYYSHTGRPAKSIRQMVGLLLVKQLKNVSDEEVCWLWTENPYVQYFCGEEFFQWGQPCNPSDLVHFRNRIGEKGVEEIFKATVYLHRERIEEEDELVLDWEVLPQEGHDKSKIYSLHDPTVLFIGKGKAHKKWGTEERSDNKPSEAPSFGRKASVAMTRDSGVIVGAVSFEENVWDGDTLDMTLIQACDVSEKEYASALVLCGYQGRSSVCGVEIMAPHRKKKTGSYYQKRNDRLRFARR